MRVFAGIMMIVATSCAGLAQSAPKAQVCPNANTQYDLDVCAGDEAKKADAELNQVYVKLLAKVAADGNATAKIKAMERAWIVYRDAYLDAMYPAKDKQAEYGTMYPMEANFLRAELTEKQVAALKRLIQGSDEP